jgi:hypothetical protein
MCSSTLDEKAASKSHRLPDASVIVLYGKDARTRELAVRQIERAHRVAGRDSARACQPALPLISMMAAPGGFFRRSSASELDLGARCST